MIQKKSLGKLQLTWPGISLWKALVLTEHLWCTSQMQRTLPYNAAQPHKSRASQTVLWPSPIKLRMSKQPGGIQAWRAEKETERQKREPNSSNGNITAE